MAEVSRAFDPRCISIVIQYSQPTALASGSANGVSRPDFRQIDRVAGSVNLLKIDTASPWWRCCATALRAAAWLTATRRTCLRSNQKLAQR
jgi:hypothetical protein